jgi:hypothetical protein
LERRRVAECPPVDLMLAVPLRQISASRALALGVCVHAAGADRAARARDVNLVLADQLLHAGAGLVCRWC